MHSSQLEGAALNSTHFDGWGCLAGSPRQPMPRHPQEPLLRPHPPVPTACPTASLPSGYRGGSAEGSSTCDTCTQTQGVSQRVVHLQIMHMRLRGCLCTLPSRHEQVPCHACSSTGTQKHTYVRACAHTHTHTRACTLARMHGDKCTSMHAPARARTLACKLHLLIQLSGGEY